MHSGGIADKVGNRYEALWLTHQVLGLLDGSVRSVTIEALGNEEQGFEFSLERVSGTEWHQCKRQTAAGTWSIPSLAAAGVLAAFARKVASDHARCVFISSDPAGTIKLLQDKVPATHNLASFEQSLSEKETQHWGVLRDRLACTGADAFRFLALTEFRTLSESDLRDMLRARLAYWFMDDADLVAARFRTWLEDDANFNRPLTYDDLMAFVQSAGLEIKQYEFDRALPGRIQQATTSYTGSYPPLGAGLFHIERSAVREVLAALGAGSRTVFLAGGAGVGKSAVLSDVIGALREAGTLTLAFRVDQSGAVASVDELGSQIIGTADNPVIVLEQLASNGKAVLIIDQADAVSEASGRIAELRRVILDLVRKAAQYVRVQVIVACRTFDLENDHAYSEIANLQGNARIDVPSFTWPEVEPVLARLGILVDEANAKLAALLCLPIGLTLAATLSRSGIVDLRTVEHLSELYRRLLSQRDHEIQREPRPGWSLFAPLTALVRAMSERQELVAPVAVLDAYGGAVQLLQRLGLIVVRGERAGFLHESLFDYLHARAFVLERRALVEFLLADEQTLFRRTQTRQILAFERELEPNRYPGDLEAMLLDPRVRPHIRETVVRWLATLPDPSPTEWTLVARYAACEGLPRKAGNVIYERKPWFDLLREQGVIEDWLTRDDEDLDWALGFLRSVAPQAPAEVARAFDKLLEDRPELLGVVLGILRYLDPKGEAEPLANSLIKALERSSPGDWSQDQSDWGDYYGPWSKVAPNDGARIFGAQLRRWFRLHLEGHPFESEYHSGGHGIYWMSELAKAAPLPFLEQILPAMHTAMQRCSVGETVPAEDSIWYWRHRDRTDTPLVSVLDLVRSALATAARDEPVEAMRLLRAIEPERYITSLHLLLEAVSECGHTLHPLLAEHLRNPGLFEAGWHHAEGHSAGKAIAAALPHLGAEDRLRCEDAILALRPELKAASRALADGADAAAPEGAKAKPSLGDYPTWCLRNSGRRQWSVLLQIDPEHLSPRARKRRAELCRKFVGQAPDEPDGIRGGWVKSPIAGERTKFMNDAAWLRAIAKFSKPRDDMSWGRDGLRGGASELSRELGERTKEDPSRFLALLAKLPDGASVSFAHGIVRGIAETKPAAHVVEEVLAVAAAHAPARPDDRTLIWLIQACSEPLGALAEETLLRVAASSDDSTGMGDPQRGEREKEAKWKAALTRGSDLFGKTINSARGSAILQLGELCWPSPESFERYRPVLDRIVGAPAAPHIHVALDIALLSALKHEGKAAADWILRTVRACPQALCTNNGQQAVHWLGELDEQSFADLLQSYLINADPEMQAFGALALFNRCLVEPGWMSLADRVLEMDPEFRAAAAAVAAASFQSTGSAATAEEWLTRFFDDDDAMVRTAAADCFRRMKTENLARFSGLFEAYATSRYFDSERTYFLRQLDHAPPALHDLVLKLIEDVLGLQTDPPVRRRGFALHDVGDIVLKIYASSSDNPARLGRCLDLIDRLVEGGLMEVRRLEVS